MRKKGSWAKENMECVYRDIEHDFFPHNIKRLWRQEMVECLVRVDSRLSRMERIFKARKEERKHPEREMDRVWELCDSRVSVWRVISDPFLSQATSFFFSPLSSLNRAKSPLALCSSCKSHTGCTTFIDSPEQLVQGSCEIIVGVGFYKTRRHMISPHILAQIKCLKQSFEPKFVWKIKLVNES